MPPNISITCLFLQMCWEASVPKVSFYLLYGYLSFNVLMVKKKYVTENSQIHQERLEMEVKWNSVLVTSSLREYRVWICISNI